MKYRLRIYPAADADVDEAAHHIARDSLDAALRFYDAADETYRQIRDHPNRWPRFELDHPKLANLLKRAIVGFRNYLAFYQVHGEFVDIIRVLHGARDIPSILLDEPTED
jgi:toxin ParE1/3/4